MDGTSLVVLAGTRLVFWSQIFSVKAGLDIGYSRLPPTPTSSSKPTLTRTSRCARKARSATTPVITRCPSRIPFSIPQLRDHHAPAIDQTA